MTREEAIEKIKSQTEPMITPALAAAVIGCNPHLIRVQAAQAPHMLGFPVMRVGNRTKIPKRAFLEFIGE